MDTTFTAWRDDSELALVRDWFFPDHIPPDPYSAEPTDMRQTAVHRVTAWTFRDPDLPHPVLATAALTEAVLHDALPNRRDYISDSAQASIYAMAFCRFVTGLVDRDVAKSSTATLRAAIVEAASDGRTTPTARGETSMFAHAAKIELPVSFVELRHRATHGKMPALGYLRRTTKEGLEWLYEKWWRQNAIGDSSVAMRRLELEKAEADKLKPRRLLRESEKAKTEQRKRSHGNEAAISDGEDNNNSLQEISRQESAAKRQKIDVEIAGESNEKSTG